MKGVIEVLDDDDVEDALGGMVERRLRQVDVAPLLARAIDVSVQGGHDQRLLDAVLKGLGTFLEENRDTLRGRLHTESPWWVPEPIDDRIFGKIFSGVQSFLADVLADPDHEVRHSLEERVLDLANRLRTDPAMIAKAEELKEELLSHPEVQAWFGSLWGSVKKTVLEAADDPESDLRVRVTDGLRQFGVRLAGDPELQRKIDDWLERTALLRRRQLQERGRRPHRRDRRPLGQPRHVPAHRAAGRPRPPVHPHQRHGRRRHRRHPDLHRRPAPVLSGR